MMSAALLDAVLEIALEAGRRIMQVYATDFVVSHKSDASPLTQADLAAHQHIATALALLTPETPLLSEEDADIDFLIRQKWSRYWLVDPLDGTREFVKRNGEFTVNIALIEDGYPVLAVIHAPVLQQTWLAAAGFGSFELRSGERIALHTRKAPEVPVLIVSQSHRNAALETFLATVPAHQVLSRGSSLKFCLIASGAADLYPRTGPISEWDSAAGQCIAEQAGAQVLALPTMQRLRYNQKASLLNPLFVVIGDASRDWSAFLQPLR